MLLDGKFPDYEDDLTRELGLVPLDLDADFALRIITLPPDDPEMVISLVRKGPAAQLRAVSAGTGSVWHTITRARKSLLPVKKLTRDVDASELSTAECSLLEALAPAIRTWTPRPSDREETLHSFWELHQAGRPPVHFEVVHPERDPDQWLELVHKVIDPHLQHTLGRLPLL